MSLENSQDLEGEGMANIDDDDVPTDEFEEAQFRDLEDDYQEENDL